MATGATARAGDAFPYFRPDLKVDIWYPGGSAVPYGPPIADPAAPECAITDAPCVADHDARTLAFALATDDRSSCDGSTAPDHCAAAYDMIRGDVAPRRDAMLDDPCTYVTRIDSGRATLYSRKDERTTHAAALPSWKAATFLGACNIKEIAGDIREGTQARELPRFPWSR